MSYKAIVFDFFGVICSEVAPQWLSEHLETEEKARAIKADIVGAADRGDLSENEMFAKLSETTNVAADDIETEWYDNARINADVVNLIEKLSQTYKIGLLTNAPSEFLHRILKKADLSRLFNVIVVSSEVGVAKPDPKIYKILLEKLALEPAEVLFVDDNAGNVKTAIDLGMKGVVFDSSEELEEALAK